MRVLRTFQKLLASPTNFVKLFAASTDFMKVVCKSRELCKVVGEFYELHKVVGKFYELRKVVCTFYELHEVLSHFYFVKLFAASTNFVTGWFRPMLIFMSDLILVVPKSGRYIQFRLYYKAIPCKTQYSRCLQTKCCYAFQSDKIIELFLTNVCTLYPLKTPENLCFFGVFRGYKMGTLARNGLNNFSWLCELSRLKSDIIGWKSDINREEFSRPKSLM